MSLRGQALVIGVIGFIGITSFGINQPQWLFGALGVWSYCFWCLWRGLAVNYRKEDVIILDSIGWPTVITLGRGALLAVIAGFIFLPIPPRPWVYFPAVAYSMASMLDYLDGKLARNLHRSTLLGEQMDMALDSVGILVAIVVAVNFGKLPLWYLAVGILRYLFVGAIQWRRRLGKPIRDLDESKLRRMLAGLQMGFLSVVLWPEVPSSFSILISPCFFGITLSMFFRDWMFVSQKA